FDSASSDRGLAPAAGVEPVSATTRMATPPVVTPSVSRTDVAAGPTAREATSLAHLEILLAEGESAVGQIVRTELYCQSITPIAVRSTDRGWGALDGIVDAEGRVGGAECRWSDESRSSDFLLVIPPELAERFTAMPEIEMNFVLRRRVPARI